jgi:catechol 2,3-dioxygenase-like lactoylglutathione lyase family enzyme
MTVPRAFSHVGISVTDLEKAVDFYSTVFGFYINYGADRDQT